MKTLVKNNNDATIKIDIIRPFRLSRIRDLVIVKKNTNCTIIIRCSNGHEFVLNRRLDDDARILRADVELRDGIDCYIAGKNREAIKHFEAAAVYGNLDAFNLVGECYLNAIGVIGDCSKAVKWFEKAAKHGNLPAMANLAYCYEKGNNGVKADIYKAESLYLKIAMQGDLGGVFGLAALYYRQSTWDKDIRSVAIKLFGLADEYDYQQAKSALDYIDYIDDLADDYDDDDDDNYAPRCPTSLAMKLAETKARITGKPVTVEWQDAMDFDKKVELAFIPEYSIVGEISESNRKEIIKSVRRILNRKR